MKRYVPKLTIAALVLAGSLALFATQASADVYRGTNVYRIPTNQKVCALTFDDGWSSDPRYQVYVGQILDALQAGGVTGTFFPTGASVALSPDVARRIVAEGHYLGSHMYKHVPPCTLTNAQIGRSLDKTEAAFKAIGARNPQPMLRAPWGSRYVNARVLWAFGFHGYANILWTVNANDVDYGMTVAKCINQVVYHLKPGAIILMHVQNKITPKALTEIIRRIQARGYRIVDIYSWLFPHRAARDAAAVTTTTTLAPAP
jgi:peptidoglycan/xylan/chitin deacetylase (PgdA/CDA1 family)